MDESRWKFNKNLNRVFTKFYSPILFILSILVYFFGIYNLALLLFFASFLFFYTTINKEEDWNENPLRINAMLFMLFHILFWIRCLIAINYTTFEKYPFIPYMINLEASSKAIYVYITMTFVYFISFYKGFSFLKRKKSLNEKYKINQDYTALIGIIIVLLALTYYLLSNLKIPIPIVLQYLGSNLESFLPLFWCLFAILILEPDKKRHKILGIIGFVISTIMGVIILNKIKMRGILLTQIIVILIVYLSLKKINVKIIIRLFLIAIILLILFGAITEIKFVNTYNLDETPRVQKYIDDLIYRLANVQVEADCVSQPKYISYLSNKKGLIIYEILGGLPLGGTFLSFLKEEASLDMQINWLHAGSKVNSSSNVPLFTSLEFGFNLNIAIIVAIIFGFFHGNIFKRISLWRFKYSWIIGTSLFIDVALSGIRRNFIFGVLVDILLYILILRIVTYRVNTTELEEKYN